jgi:hypothetical protein
MLDLTAFTYGLVQFALILGGAFFAWQTMSSSRNKLGSLLMLAVIGGLVLATIYPEWFTGGE